jgi:TRAP-type transport system small permease protein
VLKANGIVAVVLFAALTVVVGLQVLNRFVLHLPIIWSEEVARFIFFWVVLLGAAMSVCGRRHFVLDLTAGRRREGRGRAGVVFDAIPDACVFGFCVFLFVQGIDYARTGVLRTATNSGVNMSVVYAAIPVFAALATIYAARHLIAHLRGAKPPGERTSVSE